MNKNKYKILFFILFCLCIARPIQAAETLTLETNLNKNKNSIDLDWNDIGVDPEYQIYQSINNSAFQTICAANLESSDLNIKVLNIYPNVGNSLKTWMETNGYGKDIIDVTPLSIETFNASPSTYLFKDANGKWNYDVVVFGFWDANYLKDLNTASRNLIISYIKDGKGVIFGHDTVRKDLPYFASLASYIKLSIQNSYTYSPSTKIVVSKKGQFTNYPYNIGDIGTILTIPTSHTLDQVYSSTAWLKFTTAPSAGVDFYLTTYNNCAMIQTGHSNGEATADEQKLLANLIFYMDQLTTASDLSDYSGQDVNVPNAPTIGVNTNGLSMSATDNGTNYSYYVTSIIDGTKVTSNTSSVENKSGVKGYYYLANKVATTAITNANGTLTTGIVDFNNIPTGSTYLHVATVDNAGNVSTTTHIDLTKIITIVSDDAIYKTNQEDGSMLATLSVVANGYDIKYQWQQLDDMTTWNNIANATTNTYTVNLEEQTSNETLQFRCKLYNTSIVIYSDVIDINITDSGVAKVYVTQASTFGVVIPKTIILNGSNGTAEYLVQIKGNVGGNATLMVSPSGYVNMKDVKNIKSPFRATIVQEQINFVANEINQSIEKHGFVDATNKITAGNWSGTFNFDIVFNDLSKNDSIESVNQQDDGITKGVDISQEKTTKYFEIMFE